jgi:hypothetical protein
VFGYFIKKRAKYRLGKDVELKKEVVYEQFGRRLTNSGVKKIVKKLGKSGRIGAVPIRHLLKGIYFD